ncbi:MAG: ATP-binding protein [Bacteroidales bacterium]|nr:ATP-binding protein [Bacteroidales bacterium]
MIYLRKIYIHKIEKALSILPIVVLIGARQVGKTTLIKSLDLPSDKLFLNGQDVEIIEIFQKYSTLESFLKFNLNTKLEGFLLIDEFQFIPNISTMLKLLVDKNENLKILCTGSSSLDILQNVEESLAGRVRIIEVFSLSFDEYLMFTDNDLYQLYQKYDNKTVDVVVNKAIADHLERYMLFGGLPRVALVNTENEKIELLDDIYRTYLMRDVRSYIRNEDTVGFNKLLKLLAAQIGNLVNVNELSSTSGLSYKKTNEYMYLLEQMYIIKLVEPIYTNKRKVITKMRKVYFTDIGLCNLINGSFNSFNRRADAASIFENYVFLELKRKLGQAGKLFYYRTLDGTEVDFVINNFHGIISVEVKNKAIKKDVFLRNLDSFNKLFNVSESYIVNQTLNLVSSNYHYIQGYLIPKMDLQKN